MAPLVSKIFFLIYLLIISISYIKYYRKTAKKSRTKEASSGTDRILWISVLIAQIILPLIYVATDWLSFAEYALNWKVAYFGAFILLLPTIWFFRRSHKALKDNWSAHLDIYDDHDLVEQGIYKKIRHPMYTAMWLAAFSFPLVIQNYVAGCALLLVFGIFYFSRVGKEEELMETHFGEKYRAYKLRTGRILPFL